MWIADLTSEGFYTLSDKMVEVCENILDPDDGDKKEIEITFCTDPDYLIGSDAMRATYFMALALQKKFDNVSVKTVNIALDPTAVSMYRTTSRDDITASDVIFSYGAKYKIPEMSNAPNTPLYPSQLHLLERERNAPTAFFLVLRPTANSASIAGIPTTSTLSRKTIRNAAPPFSPAI